MTPYESPLSRPSTVRVSTVTKTKLSFLNGCGIFLCALCVIGLLFPVQVSATKYAGEFMALGGGARALGMGGAFISIANDASTVFWNPAGISGFKERQALFMHSERFGDMVNYNFASYVMPFNAFSSEEHEGALGFALIHLGVDDIIITSGLEWEELNGITGFQPEEGDRLIYDVNNLPKESHNDFALLSSYALKTSYGRVGGTLKILYTNSIAGYSSYGVGLDFGYLKENILPHLNVGVKLQDATGTYLSWSSGTNEFIAPALKIGTSYAYSSKPLNGTILLAVGSDFYFENRQSASQFWIEQVSADLHIGGEMQFQDRVMIRGGLDAGNPTAGAGIRIGMLGFDYAYLHHARPDGDENSGRFEATHRISAMANF